MGRFGRWAAAAALLLAGPAAAQDGRAPDGPLYRIPGQDVFHWVSPPTRRPDGRFEVWAWVLAHPGPDSEDGVDGFAFLSEIDCETGAEARRGREWWAGGRLVRVIPENRPFRVPADVFMESVLVDLVCHDRPLGERVDSRAEALRRVPRD